MNYSSKFEPMTLSENVKDTDELYLDIDKANVEVDILQGTQGYKQMIKAVSNISAAFDKARKSKKTTGTFKTSFTNAMKACDRHKKHIESKSKALDTAYRNDTELHYREVLGQNSETIKQLVEKVAALEEKLNNTGAVAADAGVPAEQIETVTE